ncbi:unnamed protein product [Nippostrongylus brasiliensis]|uniref:2-Hacid_dh domain-containing protein n=1 Tax=Nippostrongylus brasiliensis TaxID=27835 RepID=A0A0N4XZU2_NIPBR|nr:unnamed protein product [Nippostrongylus brasiliensis]
MRARRIILVRTTTSEYASELLQKLRPTGVCPPRIPVRTGIDEIEVAEIDLAITDSRAARVNDDMEETKLSAHGSRRRMSAWHPPAVVQ